MSIVSVMLAPLALLFSGAGAAEPVRVPAFPTPVAADATEAGLFIATAPEALGLGRSDHPAWLAVIESFRAPSQYQVRIEQRMTIRIVPRRPRVEPDLLMDLPDREDGPHFTERRMGRCLQVSGIAGVQVSGGNQLILFMRDHRLISATLERACRARDFYSGFYLERNADGQLCADRDMLLARNGANCKLTRIRQLVEVDE